MAKPWSGCRRSPKNNTANNRGSHPEQEVKMKRMAVIIAALSLTTT